MILAGGEIFQSSEQNKILGALEEKINRTLSSEKLDREAVISAADRLGKMISDGVFDNIIKQLSGEDYDFFCKFFFITLIQCIFPLIIKIYNFQ